jgi:hypothetical protein
MSTEERKIAQETFLATFANTANVRASCVAAKISRAILYVWLEKDQAFSILYHQSEQDAIDALLAAAWTRAVNGVPKHIVSMGKQVFVDGKPLMEREYSDAVLLRLMSWKIPGFREKQQVDVNSTVNVNHSGSLTLNTKDMTDQELQQLKQLAMAMKLREENKS